jgi:CheY-like chemotaxis protein
MTRRVLFVDDEPKVLQAFERQLSDKFEVHTAVAPDLALRMLAENGGYAVVVSDYRMPHMNGTQFLAKVKQLAPDTIRLMLTGQADFNATVDAVNEGNIFRFLTKPCSAEVLAGALDAELEQYRLVTAERELLERTVHGSVKVLSEVLSLTSPGAFSRACRLRRYVAHVATSLHLSNVWELEVAAMLCQLGCITVPQEILDKAAAGAELSPSEHEVYAGHPAVAERLLENIPRLENISRIIRNQNPSTKTQPGAGGSLDAVSAEGVALLRVCLEFDRLTANGCTRHDALEKMRQAAQYEPRLLRPLETVGMERNRLRVRMVKVRELDTTMVMNQDVYTNKGMLLLAKGEELTLPLIARLTSFAKTVGIPQPLNVLAPAFDFAGAEAPSRPRKPGNALRIEPA